MSGGVGSDVNASNNLVSSKPVQGSPVRKHTFTGGIAADGDIDMPAASDVKASDSFNIKPSAASPVRKHTFTGKSAADGAIAMSVASDAKFTNNFKPKLGAASPVRKHTFTGSVAANGVVNISAIAKGASFDHSRENLLDVSSMLAENNVAGPDSTKQSETKLENPDQIGVLEDTTKHLEYLEDQVDEPVMKHKGEVPITNLETEREFRLAEKADVDDDLDIVEGDTSSDAEMLLEQRADRTNISQTGHDASLMRKGRRRRRWSFPRIEFRRRRAPCITTYNIGPYHGTRDSKCNAGYSPLANMGECQTAATSLKYHFDNRDHRCWNCLQGCSTYISPYGSYYGQKPGDADFKWNDRLYGNTVCKQTKCR